MCCTRRKIEEARDDRPLRVHPPSAVCCVHRGDVGLRASVAYYFDSHNVSVLVGIYVHLARSEESDVRAEFGEIYERYARGVPAFIPRFGARSHRPLFGAD